MGASRLAVLKLLGLEFGDVRGQLGVLVAQFGQLLRIVAIDFGLEASVQAIAAFSLISAVAATRAKPATFHKGWSAVGRTRRSAINWSKRSR